MDLVRTFLSRTASLFRSRHLDDDLDEELRLHIDLATAENMTLGMSRKEARTKALRDFGGIVQTRETYRMRRGFPLLDQVGRDLRFGLRQLRRSPGFTLTAILTLALGLGANTAVFSLINALLLRPLPVPHAEQLAVIHFYRSDFDTSLQSACAPFIRALEKRHDSFQSIAAFSGSSFQVRGTSGYTAFSAMLVSGQFFPMLDTQPLKGRYLIPSDDQPRGGSTGFAVVISEGFWRTWFNSAPDVIGRKLTIANAPFTVVGVMPRQFIGADPTQHPQLYAPLWAEPVIDAPYSNIGSGYHSWWLTLMGRRKPGVSLQQANAALKAASNSVLEEAIPDAEWIKDAKDHHFYFGADSGSKGHSYLRSRFAKPLVAVFCLCGIMLLLACLNLASLLMARAAARERELATRLALGASRRRLIQQLLVESLLIAACGTTIGLGVSPVVSRALAVLLLGNNRDTMLDTNLDLRVFAFAALIAIVATILIGLMPALRATSGSLNEQIKNGSYAKSTRDRRRALPRLLMSLEVALALLLVTGAGLLATSLTRLYRAGLGFEPHGLVNLDIEMSKQSLHGEPLKHWYQAYADALKHLPGVKNASFESMTLLNGSNMTVTYQTPFSNGQQMIYMNRVAPDYFRTMRIPVFSGREFQWNETKDSGLKIILNRKAAKILFPGRDALGQHVVGWQNASYEVVAIVGDVKYSSIRKDAPAGAYVTITQTEEEKPSYSAVIRVDGPASPLAAAARTLAARMAPDIPAPVMTSMSSTLDASISSERMMAMLSVFFAGCALLVTAIGLYGTLAYATARRTSEIGIRMALGAQRLQVVSLVFRENAWIAVCGCVAGLGAAWMASKALASFLYGTSTHDPWVMVGSVAALVTIASAASLLPAIRAARIDPMEALRTE